MGNLKFYRDEPLFGLDIGHSSLKIMQLSDSGQKASVVTGYGFGKFPPQARSNGIIVDYESLAKALHELFEKHLYGSISTKRVACTVPTARTFSRPMRLPAMSDKDITEAVRLEAEQYIPVATNNLYIDYDIARRDEKGIELLMVAVPKNVVDSYMRLLEAVGLEPVALEPTMNASARFFSMADPAHNQPSVLIDFGSQAIDLAVFDQSLFVNNTVTGGNDNMTQLIARALNLSAEEAYQLKNKYGISMSDKQPEIKQALAPILDNLVHEIQKIVRYYNERISIGQRKIVQIITLGGGATIPGLDDYLSEQLNLPTRSLDPWRQIDFGDLPPPEEGERPMYTTVAGEALLNPGGILS